MRFNNYDNRSDNCCLPNPQPGQGSMGPGFDNSVITRLASSRPVARLHKIHVRERNLARVENIKSDEALTRVNLMRNSPTQTGLGQPKYFNISIKNICPAYNM